MLQSQSKEEFIQLHINANAFRQALELYVLLIRLGMSKEDLINTKG